ncbi:DUF3592 domain-containing protein [Actinomadura harenae]|uniref:DUF3592 domain-containing protein n=1 Tax=Actinomadura harenae TaxID=2483351 RepID=A0A3M2M034_9ACTN|nr:DUF3592 domain-containing protein [Actinomadura harenae]RMI42792.1 DUF3592 domain-containing protein [Actinomadura harenae]
MALLSLLAGLVIIGFGTYEAAHGRRLRRDGVHAEGRVIRHRQERGTDGVVTYAVVGFVDAQGTTHEFEPTSSGARGLPVGGRVPVLFLPGAPNSARVDRTGRRLAGIVGPLAGGSVFTAIGIWLLATGR